MKKIITEDKYEIMENGCWIWKGAKNSGGYGQMVIDGSKVYAHRVSFVENKGKIIGDNVVMHSCDCPSCVNPDHLSQGTQGDNIRDAARKGHVAGGKVGRKKTSDTQVAVLRREYAAGYSMYAIAKRHGLPQSTVFMIVTNQRRSLIKA